MTLTQHGGVGMVVIPSPPGETEVLSAIRLSKKALGLDLVLFTCQQAFHGIFSHGIAFPPAIRYHSRTCVCLCILLCE